MVFKSYMDETGIQTADPYCSIAGYVAPVEEWKDFEHDWRFILNEYMWIIPEPHRYFHALEFYGNDKKYRNWTSAKRESFEAALLKAINDKKLALFLSIVDSAVFFSMTEDERRFLTGGQHNGMKWKQHGAPTKPYFLPFQFCLIQSANFIRNGDKVFPIMSRQEQYKMKAMELYELMLNTDPPMQCRHKLADDLVFSDPKKVPALQAADLAIYWFGQFNNWKKRTQSVLSDGYPQRVQLMRLMKNVKSMDDLKLFDFNGLMLGLSGCNRYIKTSFPTLDQALPSLPIPRRREVLAKMRKVNFRRLLDQWQSNTQRRSCVNWNFSFSLNLASISPLAMTFFSISSLSKFWNLYCCSAIDPRRRFSESSSIEASNYMTKRRSKVRPHDARLSKRSA